METTRSVGVAGSQGRKGETKIATTQSERLGRRETHGRHWGTAVAVTHIKKV